MVLFDFPATNMSLLCHLGISQWVTMSTDGNKLVCKRDGIKIGAHYKTAPKYCVTFCFN